MRGERWLVVSLLASHRAWSFSSLTSRRRLRAVSSRQSVADDRRESEEDSWLSAGELKLLYKRISATRELLALADRACVENWRRGAMDQTAVVRLEDARVSQARLHGETCAFGTSKGSVVVIDLVGGDIIDGYEGHDGEVTALDWDGSRLLTGGVDGTVRVFQPQSRREGGPFEMVDEDYEEEEEDYDDESIASAVSVAIEATKGDAGAAALARAPLYRVLCKEFETEDNEAIIVEVPPLNDEEEESIALKGHSSRVTGVRVVGGVVYSCSLDKQILAWDLESRQGRLVATTESAVCCLCVAHNLAIVGMLNGGVAAYDLKTGALAFDLPRAHDGAVRALHVAAVDPWDKKDDLDGRVLATGGMDGVIKIFSLERVDGALRPVKPKPHAAAPTTDYQLRRRRDRVGAHTLHGHAGAVVAVQADGTKLVSGATDGSVRVWSLRSGQQLYAIQGLSQKLSSLHFDKHLLVCDGTDESIVVHDFSDPRASRPRRTLDDDDDDGDYA